MSEEQTREQTEAKEALSQIPNSGTHELLTPISFEDKKVEKLDYDFDALTGEDLLDAAREVKMVSNDVRKAIYFDPDYQAAVFARSAKVPLALIKALKARDFVDVTARVQIFLTMSR